MSKPISKKDQVGKVELCVTLNGTAINPYTKFGLIQSPFPQIAKAELMPAMMQLNKLAADPIPINDHEYYIRETLKGWSKEFINLCIQNFVPGMLVSFHVYLNKEWCE